MSKVSLAPKILRELYEAGALSRESIDEIFADVANEQEVGNAMQGLNELQLAKRYHYWDYQFMRYCEDWCPRDSPLFQFLNGEKGEFTQRTMCDALGVSQPVVSRKLKLLRKLGLVLFHANYDDFRKRRVFGPRMFESTILMLSGDKVINFFEPHGPEYGGRMWIAKTKYENGLYDWLEGVDDLAGIFASQFKRQAEKR